MSEGKIEITIGDISFVGEGEQNWVAEQLDKILEKAPELTTSHLKKNEVELLNSPVVPYRGNYRHDMRNQRQVA